MSADASSFRFEGTRRLYGDARFAALADAHVVVLGMGGVGSWAVEALARGLMAASRDGWDVEVSRPDNVSGRMWR